MFAWGPRRGINSGFNCLLGFLGGESTLDLIVFQGAPWSKGFTGRTQTAAACRFFTGFSQLSHSRVLGISSSQAWPRRGTETKTAKRRTDGLTPRLGTIKSGVNCFRRPEVDKQLVLDINAVVNIRCSLM